MKQFLALAALLLAGLAGCLDSGSSDDSPDTMPQQTGPQPWARFASGNVPEAPEPSIFEGTIHDSHAVDTISLPASTPVGSNVGLGHQLPELHTGGHGFDLMDQSTLGDGLIGPSSGFIEIHVVGDLMVVSSILGTRGATLVDVSDPNDLRVLSHIYNGDDNWDARISDDAKYLFIGCQGSSVFDCTGVDQSGEGTVITGGTVCASIANCPGGIVVYNIEDPTNPVFEGYLPMGFTHNVYSYIRDDKYYFMNAGIHIAEWDPANGTMKSATTEIAGVHDIFVQQHPFTGDWILYTGAGGGGLALWNVTDPFAPTPMSEIRSDENQTMAPMWHEQTPMPCIIDGRHITIGAGESGGGIAQSIGIVDTTNPEAPIYLGDWQLPDAKSLSPQGMYRFSVHNIDGNCDGQVALGHYHAGVWVFDISTKERQANPATLGYYQPHERPVGTEVLGWSPVTGGPIGLVITADIPNVWAAQWSADGNTLFIPDMSTGVYSLKPTWNHVATA